MFELIEGHHPDVPSLKLGLNPAKFDARTPSLIKIVQDFKLKIPPTVARMKNVTQPWGMMGNDTYGDCDWAMWAHSLITMDADQTGKVPLQIHEDTVTAAYLRYTGGGDNGTNMLDSTNLRLHNVWANYGQSVADFFVGLDLGSHLEASVKASVYLVGSASLGVGLPLALQKTPYDWAGTPNPRDPNWKPGSWGGHAVAAYDYDAHGVTIVTWGKPCKVSWPMLKYIMSEGYAVSHPNFRNRKGSTPDGLTLAMVKKYLPTAA